MSAINAEGARARHAAVESEYARSVQTARRLQEEHSFPRRYARASTSAGGGDGGGGGAASIDTESEVRYLLRSRTFCKWRALAVNWDVAVESVAVGTICDAMSTHAADAAVAIPSCRALAELCSPGPHAARRQAIACSSGALQSLAGILARASGRRPDVVSAACLAVERLVTGRGAAARRVLAAEAGLLMPLVQAAARADDSDVLAEERDEAEAAMVAECARVALREVTRGTPWMQEAAQEIARDLGAPQRLALD